MMDTHMQANGADIHVEQRGDGPQNVLLLHGWGCTTEIWKPVTERLSQQTRVTVIDFPGHGQSGWPPAPWGAEEHAAMVAALIDSLSIGGCDVVGHSHGGRIGLLLAATYPEKVGKLVVTGAAGLRAEASESQQRRSATYKRLRGVANGLDRIRILGPLPARMRESLVQRYGSADYRVLDEEMRKTFVKLVNFDVTAALPLIQAPTLLVWGDQDTETPLWMGEKMESLIPDAGLVVLKGGTHYAFLEQCGAFLRIVEHFLFGGSA